jgi:hypothetical protein
MFLNSAALSRDSRFKRIFSTELDFAKKAQLKKSKRVSTRLWRKLVCKTFRIVELEFYLVVSFDVSLWRWSSPQDPVFCSPTKLPAG